MYEQACYGKAAAAHAVPWLACKPRGLLRLPRVLLALQAIEQLVSNFEAFYEGFLPQGYVRQAAAAQAAS